jgi:hypothetical protein
MYGPNPEAYDFDYLFSTKKDAEVLKFVLDKNTLEILPNASKKTTLKEIDRTTQLEPYKKDNDKRMLSAAFTKNNLHYIYQDRKTKEIRIQVKLLH